MLFHKIKKRDLNMQSLLGFYAHNFTWLSREKLITLLSESVDKSNQFDMNNFNQSFSSQKYHVLSLDVHFAKIETQFLGWRYLHSVWNQILFLIKIHLNWICQVNTYLLKFNNRNTKRRCEICLKLTEKTPFSSSLSLFWTGKCFLGV